MFTYYVLLLRYLNMHEITISYILYQLWARSHTVSQINETKFLNDNDFLVRVLYKHSYQLYALPADYYMR